MNAFTLRDTVAGTDRGSPLAHQDDAVAGREDARRRSAETRAGRRARLMAITITPVRRLMSASRTLRPASGLAGAIKSSSISISTLDRLVTSSANSTAAGLVRSETIRCADRGGHHDVVCAGLLELLGRARPLGPRNDHEVGAHLPRRST